MGRLPATSTTSRALGVACGPWALGVAPSRRHRHGASRPLAPRLHHSPSLGAPGRLTARRAGERAGAVSSTRMLLSSAPATSSLLVLPGVAWCVALAAAPPRVQHAEAAAGAPNIYGARWSQEETLVASHLEPGKLLMCGWSVAVRLGRQAPLLTGPFPGLCRRYSPCNTPQTWPAPVGKRHQSVSSGRGAFGRE